MSVSSETMSTVDGGPVFSGMLTDEDVRLTSAAQAKMAELMGDLDDDIEAVRVFVSGGGCGGMTYGMTYTDTIHPYDKVMQGDGFKIMVDAVALSYLHGSDIDFVDNGVNASFVFNNVFKSCVFALYRSHGTHNGVNVLLIRTQSFPLEGIFIVKDLLFIITGTMQWNILDLFYQIRII